MPASPPHDRLPAVASDEALYLYGIVCSDTLTVDHPGLDDETPVRTGALGAWTVVVDVVPVGPWTGAEGEKNLQSLSWVAPRACRHEEIVEAVMHDAPVFPARFGTLFSSEDELYQQLAAHSPALTTYFERVRGAAEWGVKGLLDRDAAQQHLAGSTSDDDASGAAYLRRRKREQDARRDVEAWLLETADAMLDALSESARGVRVLDPQERPDVEEEPVLNWAFLISDDTQAAFEETLDALRTQHADHGLTLERSGPWPPYHFRPSLTEGTSPHR